MTQRHAAIAALAVLLGAPMLAVAQTTGTTTGSGTVTVAESHDQDNIINIPECENQVQDRLQLSWSFTSSSSTTVSTGPFTILVSNQSGCAQSGSSNTSVVTQTVQSNVSQTTFADPQTVSQRILSVYNGCVATASTLFVCVQDSTGATITGSIPLDLATPPPPVENTPTPGDSALNVSWSPGGGSVDAGAGAAFSYNVYCDVHPATSPIAKKCASVTGQGTTNTRITGLTNGTSYDVEITALSQGGNESAHSNTETGAPQMVNDFWRLYKSDGGPEQGGCSLGTGGVMALLALLAPLALRLRRGRP